MKDQSVVTLWFMIQLLGNYEYGLVDIIYWLIHIKIDDIGKIPAKKYKNNLNLIGRLCVPRTITSIGNGAFEGCAGLISVSIPDSIEYIGEDAFSGCSGLTSITIPKDTRISFSSCSFPEGCRIDRR